MKPVTGVLLGLACGSVLMMFARSWDFGRLSDELEAATDSIAALEVVADQLEAQTDSLRTLALTRDTVLVALTDTVKVEIDRARESGQASTDSLRATLDSAQNVHLVNIEAAHNAEVVAIWRIADERLVWGESWRTLAQSQNSLIASQAARLALYDVVNTGLRSALVRERTQTWLTRGAAVVGVAAVLVLK